MALVGVAEKGAVSLELVAEAPGGHSSMPPRQSAVGIVAEVVRSRGEWVEPGLYCVVSFFERSGNTFFNSLAMLDADGTNLGVYRKSHIPQGPGYERLRGLMRGLDLHTVCEEASCPNLSECWSSKHATVMILGRVCTRACAFCNVTTGKPSHLDPDEPARVAGAIAVSTLTTCVVFLPVLFIMSAFTINVAYMHLSRAELRTSTESAARAAGPGWCRYDSCFRTTGASDSRTPAGRTSTAAHGGIA